MAKSKDRLMLEKLFQAAAENNLYEDFCHDGREVLKSLAKHLNKPLSEICGDPIETGLRIYTGSFQIEDIFNEDDLSDDPEKEFTVEVFVTRKNKRTSVSVDSVEWYN